jgi:hypothetical protein
MSAAPSLPSCYVAEMPWLSVPARGKLDGQGCMHEAGDCSRVGPVGSPLQRERNQLLRLDGAAGGASVRLGEGRNEQYPIDLCLVGPPHGSKVGVGEDDGAWVNIGGF